MQQHRLTKKGEPVFVISWHFISDVDHHINSPVNTDLTTAGRITYLCPAPCPIPSIIPGLCQRMSLSW